jgi:hypothetical protein
MTISQEGMSHRRNEKKDVPCFQKLRLQRLMEIKADYATFAERKFYSAAINSRTRTHEAEAKRLAAQAKLADAHKQ